MRMNKLIEELGLDSLGSKYVEEMDKMQKRMSELTGDEEGQQMQKGVTRPLADVQETDDSVIVTMDMPGVEKEDIDISVVDEELRVSAEKSSQAETKEEQFHKRERTYRKFERRVLLPASIKADEARASLANGVLEITLPKVSVVTRRQIAIE